MRTTVASLVGACLLTVVAAAPASADVALVSPRLVATAQQYGGQMITVTLQTTCDDPPFGYFHVELRQRNKTSTGFAGYVTTYNSVEVTCDGAPQTATVALYDNRFRSGGAELQAYRYDSSGTLDSTGWVAVKIAKR